METVLEAVPRQIFPKERRLRKSNQYRFVRKNGSSLVGNWIVIDFLEGRTGATCLGLTVTTKFGKSHQRNRFKRMVREIFRTHAEPSATDGLWLNIRPRHAARNASFADIKQEFASLLREVSPV